ncbi:Equilibrative nucleotide transporter 3 [Quillaja saponaria]|uniref:Equilibrative nucleotide transporter 3 n=1 Tax=Quillaja saponaria TaxID=32244 RepID=A0AAD7M2G5_QUISA|nr:Equilibrative nucleotide transporter 3 [Quillaja saponaria]
MSTANENGAPICLEGKYKAIVVCFILGVGTLVAWNSMLTIEDYYYQLFPKYHPSRTPELIRIQPFFCKCFIGSNFGFSHIRERRSWNLYWSLCPFCFIWSCRCPCTRWNGWRLYLLCALNYSNHFLLGAILFLAISSFFEFLCILLYAIYFPKLPIVKYYRSKAASEGSKTVSSDLAAGGIQTEANQELEEVDTKDQERFSNKQLFFQNTDYAVVLFLIYVLTLSIFPGFLYENTGSHQLGTWYPLVLVAMYNLWDLISRYIPLIECLKLESRKGLMVATISRFLLIPAFYFTAKYGDQGWMILLISFLGLTNGYLTVCVLTVAPKGYKGPEQNALGNLLVLCLLCGIFAGVVLDWLWLIGKADAF